MTENKTPLSEVKGISKKTLKALDEANINTIEELSKYSLEELQNKIPTISKTTLKRLLDKVNELKASTEPVKKSMEKTKAEKTEKTIKTSKKISKKEKPVKEEERKSKVKGELLKKPSKIKKSKISLKQLEPIRKLIGRVYSFERGGARISNNRVLAHILDPSKKLEELLGVKVWLKYGKNITVKGKIIGKHGNASKVKIRLDRPVSTVALNAPIYLRG